jgi:hypothetical protein
MAAPRVRALFASASGGEPSRNGAWAAASWLRDRNVTTAPTLKHWHVEVSLGVNDSIPAVTYDDAVETRFHIDVYGEEWGFFFCHGGRASWVRVTDIPFVHGRDDFALLARTPALSAIGALLRDIEQHHSVAFRRDRALVRTNIAGAEDQIRRWVESL